MTNATTNVWHAERFRLSTFLVDPIVPENHHFWKQATGQTPNERRHTPHQQRMTEIGPYKNGNLSVDIQAGRCDWHWVFSPPQRFGYIPSLGLQYDATKQFHELMQQWIQSSPPTSRIAYGSVFLLATKNLQETNNILNQLIPNVEIDIENTSDLLYRANIPQISDIRGTKLKINRIITWSSIQIIDLELSTGMAENLQNQPVQARKMQDFCRMEFDINILHNPGMVVDHNLLPDILANLVNLSNQSLNPGD